MRSLRALHRVGVVLFVGGCALVLTLGGCGARGPLDLDDEVGPGAADASVDADPVRSAEPDAGPPRKGDARDAGREAGVVECGMCVITTCGSTIVDCVRDPACRDVFQCVATTCLGIGGSDGGAGGGGGGLNPLCLFQCAGKDPKGAAGAISVFQCVTGKCGPDCNALLGGLGGLGGGGGKGGFGGNGNADTIDPSALLEVLSPWPELCTPAAPVSTPTH